jgi:hypothetical protein
MPDLYIAQFIVKYAIATIAPNATIIIEKYIGCKNNILYS